MLHYNRLLINLKYYETNHIFRNSKKQMLRLTRTCHLTRLKDNKVYTSLKFDGLKEPESSFVDMMEYRFKQARRSILVQVKSDKYFSEFNDFCSSFGEVRIYNYILSNSKLCFSLVELKETEAQKEMQLSFRQPNCNLIGLPYRSPFLKFHHTNISSVNKICNNIVTGCGMIPNEDEINNSLMQMETVCEQIVKLYELIKLDELGVRLRFFTALQIESALSGIFPGSLCLPFGSTVNGCGRLGSDLDLVLSFNTNSEENTAQNSQLVYQVKTKTIIDRVRLQKSMEIIADCIHNFLPGCNNVIRILQARVPIIKYKHEYTGLDCDLSLTNINAVTMSKLLYTLSSIDWRIRPLLLMIKYWAEKANVTNPFPGRWISNFSLSLLVMFYLQQIKIIPNLDHVVNLKVISHNETDCEVTCTLLFDTIERFINENQNNLAISEILLGFFEYYLKFDFSSNGISLNSGHVVSKKNIDDAMYIVNPLDQALNVSKNISFDETIKIQEKLSLAFNIFSSQLIQGKDNGKEWGIIPLMKDDLLQDKINKFKINTRTFGKPRLVNVSDLFDGN